MKDKGFTLIELLVFQSSLGPKPECDGLILACVLDGAQGAVCVNPPKRARGR